MRIQFGFSPSIQEHFTMKLFMDILQMISSFWHPPWCRRIHDVDKLVINNSGES